MTTSTDKLIHSNQSNCLPSSSASPISNNQIDQDDPCIVYWDDYQQLGFINQIKSRKNDASSKTISKNTLLSKRNSTTAEIPSPSKPQTNEIKNQFHSNRKALRDSKRRKDKKTLPTLNNTINQSTHSTNTTPLPQRQRVALDALASKITLRNKLGSLVSNQIITPKSYQLSTSIKGKQPNRTNQDENKLQLLNHLVSNQDISLDSSIIETPSKITLLQKGNISDLKLSKNNLKPNLQSHPTRIKSQDVEPTNQKDQKLNNSDFINQYQLGDESKIIDSIQPVMLSVKEIKNSHTTIMKKEEKEKRGVVELICEPWDVEEDEEFGSQLLQLVDLVEKEQDEIVTKPDLIKENKMKKNEQEINNNNSLKSKNVKKNNFKEKEELINYSKIESRSEDDKKSKIKSKQNTNRMTNCKKQSTITATYKNTMIVSKSSICNVTVNQVKNNQEKGKTNELKTSSNVSGKMINKLNNSCIKPDVSSSKKSYSNALISKNYNICSLDSLFFGLVGEDLDWNPLDE